MTPAAYYAAIRAMGLTPSNVPNVYLDRDRMTQSVPDPDGMTPDQREETIAFIRRQRGLGGKPE
jgi:antitoxin component of RelBE/YafQ-DinJ toxin-antitoxin module